MLLREWWLFVPGIDESCECNLRAEYVRFTVTVKWYIQSLLTSFKG
jgi:hypothetical protein